MSNQNILSSADVARLLQDPNADNRAEAAAKVASTFASSGLNDKERHIAEDIFRVMLKDAAVRVRQALSDSLKDNPEVPHDVAVTLAQDVDAVALPIIEQSVVLNDEDLVEIVQTRSALAQQAVAKREVVSETVSEAIANTDNEEAIAALVSNEGAAIGEKTFEKVLDKYSESDLIKTPMAQRQSLPINVSERLVTMVSEKLREHILANHAISATTASDLLLESREKATVSLLEGGTDRSAVIELVDQLYANKRLTPTLILRALCMGDTTFFETALAKMAGIPVVNAYKLVHDKGELGIRRLFEVAKVPQQFVGVAQVALELADEMLETAGDNSELFRQLMIERVLTRMEDAFDSDAENMDYLIGKLHKVASADVGNSVTH